MKNRLLSLQTRPSPQDIFGAALGLFACLGQIVLLRESLGLTGGVEITFGLGFAAWLLGVGAGAALAGPLKRAEAWVGPAGIFATFAMIAGLFLLRLHRHWLSLPPGGELTLYELTGILGVALGAGGLSVGFLFTAAARAAREEERSPVSRLYASEAVGSLVGGLAFAFLLAGRTSHVTTSCMSGAVLLVGLAVHARSRFTSFVAWGAAATLLTVAATGGSNRLDRWAEERAFDAIGAADTFSGTLDSPYGRLTLGKSEDQYVMLVDGRVDHVFPDPWERPIPVHLALVQHSNPKSVLIIGGGPSDLLSAALAHGPDRVVLTYRNRSISDLSRPHWSEETLAALADPRVSVVRDDGRHFVSTTTERFDVVLVRAGPPQSAGANRYHTLEFFTAVSEILNPGGNLTVLTSGGANVLAPEAKRIASSELTTLQQVFEHVVAVPGIQTVLHAASKRGAVSPDPEVLARRYRSRDTKSQAFSPRRFAELMDADRMQALLATLDPAACINTDEKPIVYLAALQLWERSITEKSLTKAGTISGMAERFNWVWLAAPLALGLLFLLGYFGRGGDPAKGASVFAISTTGAAGMASSVVILYAFQAASGEVYEWLAVLIALFMAGLAGGAFVGRQRLAKGRFGDALIADAVVLGFLLASGPLLTACLASPAVICAWSLVAGVVTGISFPVFVGLAATGEGADERKVASAIEATDHVGAAFGALVTGIVWLPTLGITTTFLLFSGFKVASTLVLLVIRKRIVTHT